MLTCTGESVTNDKLQEQYKSTGRSTSSSSQKSLFSALDHSEVFYTQKFY